MRYEIKTKRGYALLDVASALQKAIRRGDIKLAGYFALELFESGFANYCWKRLLTVSAEDVETWVTKEIVALHYSYVLINTPKKDKPKGRIFISKAVVILCRAIKSRDTDHLQNFVYDKMLGIDAEEIDKALEEARGTGEVIEIPEYAYDVHTKKGKRAGKTKKDFFLQEQESLFPDSENDLFRDKLMEYIKGIE